MILIEIPNNPNCAPVDGRIFHDLTPPQAVRQVRMAFDDGTPRWYDVTGWTAAGAPCPAVMQKVDDSGDGVAFLVHGGEAGLRLQPSGDERFWALDAPGQRGEPFLLIGDASDVRLAATDAGARHPMECSTHG